MLAAAVALLCSCTTSGTPSVAQPPVTVTATQSQTTTVRTTSTVAVTETVSSPAPPETLVVATFKDPATFECTDTTADSCWALTVTTSGPCPNGAYVAIGVHKPDQTETLQVLETTSAPITDALGGTVEVQLSQTGLVPAGEDLRANVQQSRCA